MSSRAASARISSRMSQPISDVDEEPPRTNHVADPPGLAVHSATLPAKSITPKALTQSVLAPAGQGRWVTLVDVGLCTLDATSDPRVTRGLSVNGVALPGPWRIGCPRLVVEQRDVARIDHDVVATVGAMCKFIDSVHGL